MQKIIILAIAILSLLSMTMCNDHKYADTDCPICGSVDVLDISDENDNEISCHCVDCGVNFIIEK